MERGIFLPQITPNTQKGNLGSRAKVTKGATVQKWEQQRLVTQVFAGL